MFLCPRSDSVDFEEIIKQEQEYLPVGVTRCPKVNVGLQHLICPWLQSPWMSSLREHLALQLLTCPCSDTINPGWGEMMQCFPGETETEEWLTYGIVLLRSLRTFFLSCGRSS